MESSKTVYGINIENNIGIKKRMPKDNVANTHAIEVSIEKREWNNNIYKKKSDLNMDIAEVILQECS